MPDFALSAAPGVPTLPFDALASALGEPLRWAILRELASGERLMVKEIAERTGRPPTLISKHLGVLRKLGLVAIQQRLYAMPQEWIADREARVLDLGYCLLRLDSLPK